MITVTKKYDAGGKFQSETAHHSEPPSWLWRDVWTGLAIALAIASQIF